MAFSVMLKIGEGLGKLQSVVPSGVAYELLQLEGVLGKWWIMKFLDGCHLRNIYQR